MRNLIADKSEAKKIELNVNDRSPNWRADITFKWLVCRSYQVLALK